MSKINWNSIDTRIKDNTETSQQIGRFRLEGYGLYAEPTLDWRIERSVSTPRTYKAFVATSGITTKELALNYHTQAELKDACIKAEGQHGWFADWKLYVETDGEQGTARYIPNQNQGIKIDNDWTIDYRPYDKALIAKSAIGGYGLQLSGTNLKTLKLGIERLKPLLAQRAELNASINAVKEEINGH